MAVAAVTPNWLGDLVMSADAVGLIRSSLGGEPLHVWAPGQLAPLAELILPADEVVGFRLRRAASRLHDRVTLACSLRRHRYRAVVLFPNSLSTALVARMSGAPERVGTPMHSRGWLLTTAVDPPREGEHEGDAYLRVAAAAVGLEEPLASAGLARGEAIPVHDRVRRKARELLVREGLDPDRERFLVIAPGAAYGPAKRYGAEAFAEVARRLKRRGLRPVVDGSPGEEPLCREIAALAEEGDPVVTAGRTGLVELAGMLALASGFVGNDSGAAHLAAAVGIPTVALFLSTNPDRTSPRGPRVRVLASEVDCRPCLRRTCPRGTYECREAIRPADVLGALDGLGAFG